MIVIVFKYLTPKGFRGITIFPFVFLSNSEDKNNAILINHERIHIRQQLELLIVPFFLIYFFEFILKIIKYKDWKLVYENISFEKEAYKNEKDLNYLKKRSFWSFLKYY